MEKIQWKVEGMDCTTCAINIHKYLEKQGMKNIRVNYATGDVIFDAQEKVPEEKISKGISDLGYRVVTDDHDHAHHHEDDGAGFLKNHFQRFLFCLPFTAVLMVHMLGV